MNGYVQVRLKTIRMPEAEPHPNAGKMGAVLVADGTVVGTGEPVTFIGDKRMLWQMQHALDDGAIVVAEVEGWQIIGRSN